MPIFWADWELRVNRCGKPGEPKGLDGLIVSGGESTTMLNLANNYDIIEPLRRLGLGVFPMMGTCAGMILLAKTNIYSDIKELELIKYIYLLPKYPDVLLLPTPEIFQSPLVTSG